MKYRLRTLFVMVAAVAVLCLLWLRVGVRFEHYYTASYGANTELEVVWIRYPRVIDYRRNDYFIVSYMNFVADKQDENTTAETPLNMWRYTHLSVLGYRLFKDHYKQPKLEKT